MREATSVGEGSLQIAALEDGVHHGREGMARGHGWNILPARDFLPFSRPCSSEAPQPPQAALPGGQVFKHMSSEDISCSDNDRNTSFLPSLIVHFENLMVF